MPEDLNLDRIRADAKDVKARRVVADNILPTLSCLVVEDIPAMADEVERLRAKVARRHEELRNKSTDLLNIRGILKPAPGVGDPVVPMPLGHEVAPAVEWLAGETERLRDAEDRVHRAFADADVEGVDLNAMTVAELTAFVMAAINGGER